MTATDISNRQSLNQNQTIYEKLDQHNIGFVQTTTAQSSVSLPNPIKRFDTNPTPNSNSQMLDETNVSYENPNVTSQHLKTASYNESSTSRDSSSGAISSKQSTEKRKLDEQHLEQVLALSDVSSHLKSRYNNDHIEGVHKLQENQNFTSFINAYEADQLNDTVHQKFNGNDPYKSLQPESDGFRGLNYNANLADDESFADPSRLTWLKLLACATVPVIGWLYALSRIHYVRDHEVASYTKSNGEGRLLKPGLHLLLNPFNRQFHKHAPNHEITAGTQKVYRIEPNETGVLYNASENRYHFVGSGKYQINARNIWLTNRYKQEQRFHIEAGTQKLIYMSDHQIGVVKDTAQNKHYFLAPGWHHLENANLSYQSTHNTSDHHIQYHDKQLINVPQNQVAVFYDKVSNSHHFLPAGRYYINNSNLVYKNKHEISEEAICYQDKQLLSIPENKIGVIYDNATQRYYFLAPGRYEMSGRNLQYVEQRQSTENLHYRNRHLVHIHEGELGKLYDYSARKAYMLSVGSYEWDDYRLTFEGRQNVTDELIANNNLKLVHIPEGYIGLTYNNNTGKYQLLEPGKHQLEDPHITYRGKESLNKELVSLGKYQLLTVKEGEAVVTYDQGHLTVLTPGQWLLDDNQRIRYEVKQKAQGPEGDTKELAQKQDGDSIVEVPEIAKINTSEDTREISRTDNLSPIEDKYGVNLERLEAYSYDNVPVNIGASMTYKITNPKLAAKEFCKNSVTQDINEHIFRIIRDRVFSTVQACVSASKMNSNTKIQIMPFKEEIERAKEQIKNQKDPNMPSAPMDTQDFHSYDSNNTHKNANHRAELVARLMLDLESKGIEISGLSIDCTEVNDPEIKNKLNKQVQMESDLINAEREQKRQEVENETERQKHNWQLQKEKEQKEQQSKLEQKQAYDEYIRRYYEAKGEAERTKQQGEADNERLEKLGQIMEKYQHLAEQKRIEIMAPHMGVFQNARLNIFSGGSQDQKQPSYPEILANQFFGFGKRVTSSDYHDPFESDNKDSDKTVKRAPSDDTETKQQGINQHSLFADYSSNGNKPETKPYEDSYDTNSTYTYNQQN